MTETVFCSGTWGTIRITYSGINPEYIGFHRESSVPDTEGGWDRIYKLSWDASDNLTKCIARYGPALVFANRTVYF